MRGSLGATIASGFASERPKSGRCLKSGRPASKRARGYLFPIFMIMAAGIDPVPASPGASTGPCTESDSARSAAASAIAAFRSVGDAWGSSSTWIPRMSPPTHPNPKLIHPAAPIAWPISLAMRRVSDPESTAGDCIIFTPLNSASLADTRSFEIVRGSASSASIFDRRHSARTSAAIAKATPAVAQWNPRSNASAMTPTITAPDAAWLSLPYQTADLSRSSLLGLLPDSFCADWDMRVICIALLLRSVLLWRIRRAPNRRDARSADKSPPEGNDP